MHLNRPLVILTGPTAVGKTKASIGLAKAIGGEIISADSMQVYRHMDIGSAKVTREEMDGVPHHLINVLDPCEEFHVVRFQTLAKQAIAEIYGRNHVPVIVGGTGFYIQSVLYDIDFTDTAEDVVFRQEMTELAEKQGAQKLHEMLAAVDPKSAEMIPPQNVKRVIRALEFYKETGKQISVHNQEQRQKEAPWNFAYFVLNDERGRLYERIDSRVDAMIAAGLEEEVAALRKMGCKKDMTSMQGLGYKEMYAYLEGEYSLDEAIYRIKRDTRHFAKRQITWFKREREVIWIDRQEYQTEEAILQRMLDVLTEKMIGALE